MEIKGAVAKRFNRQNLFQVACFDLRERFHYVVLLSFVCLRNLSEVDWDFGAVLCSVYASMYRLLYATFSLLFSLLSLLLLCCCIDAHKSRSYCERTLFVLCTWAPHLVATWSGQGLSSESF